MSDLNNTTSLSTPAPGMGHNRPPRMSKADYEKTAESLASLAFADASDAVAKGENGTSTQRMSAAICYHHKAHGKLAKLSHGLVRGEEHKRSKAWEDLLAEMLSKFNPGVKPKARNPKTVTPDEETMIKAYNARNALITLALRLACIMDSFGYDVTDYFDTEAGLWNIFCIKMVPNDPAKGWRLNDPKLRMHLNGKPFVIMGKGPMDYDTVNMTARDLIERYDPPRSAKQIAEANQKREAAKKAAGRPSDTPKGEQISPADFDRVVRALHEHTLNKKGQVTYIPRGIGTGENMVTVELYNMVQDLARVANVWAKELSGKLPKSSKPAATPPESKGDKPNAPFAIGQATN
jgi:hypothetical protein